MQTRQTSIINWIWLVWFYFISYTQSAFWHHLWIHITLSIITFFWYHISLDVFWKLNFSIHFLIKDKVLPCKTSVINRMWLALLQLNRTQSFEIIHFASYWLWHSFYLNAHSIHILIKDEVQTCKKSIINGIWLALLQFVLSLPFEFIHLASYDIHFSFDALMI